MHKKLFQILILLASNLMIVGSCHAGQSDSKHDSDSDPAVQKATGKLEKATIHYNVANSPGMDGAKTYCTENCGRCHVCNKKNAEEKLYQARREARK